MGWTKIFGIKDDDDNDVDDDYIRDFDFHF